MASLKDIAKRIASSGLLGPGVSFLSDDEKRKGLTKGVSNAIVNPTIKSLKNIGTTATLMPQATASYLTSKVNPQLGARMASQDIFGTQSRGQQMISNPMQTLKDQVGASVKLALSAYGLGSSPTTLASTAALGGGIRSLAAPKGERTQAFWEGVGESPMYSGMGRFSQRVTSPLVSKFTSNPLVASRLGQGAINVGEGIGFGAATGQVSSPTSLAIDFAAGTLGKPFQPGTQAIKSDFRLDKLTFDELVKAEDMIKNPTKYVSGIRAGTKKGSKLLNKQAEKEVQRQAFEIVDRIAAKYLPDADYNRLKTPEAMIKRLVDLSAQNKLANVPGMGLVDQGKKQFPEIETKFAKSQPESKLPPLKSDNQNEVEVTTAFIKELDETPDNAFVGAVRSFLNPLSNLSESTQQTIKNWRNQTLEANQKANQVFDTFEQQFKGIEGEEGLKYFDAVESGNASLPGAQQLRQHLDIERQRALDAGLSVGYVDNYLNHVWDNNVGEILKAKGISKNLPRGRVIPTYKEGINLGLTPKFTNPSQLAAHYTRSVDMAIANKQFADELIGSGKLLTRSQAQKAGEFGWKSIDAPFFPKATTRMGRDSFIVEDYVAPPKVAETLNNIFEDKAGNVILNAAANLSKKVQDISLSGGVPYTPLNAFSFANALKEIQAGRFKSPVKAFVLSTLGDGQAKNYFQDNAEYVQKMARQGVPSYNNLDYRSAYQKTTKNRGFADTVKTLLGEKWDQAISEPTFKRFIPMLQTEFYKDTYEGMLKSGLDASQAEKRAAEATKNFYGIVDSFTRSKNNEDVLSAVFFAPRFREAMINFWDKNARALNPKNLGKQEYRANQKYIIGSILTYGLMSALNKELTGHYPWENKPGKELALEIPIGENKKGNERSWFIPLNPSIGTVPRRVFEAGGELLGGDVAGAASKAGTFFSQPVSVGNQLLTNRTFYGGPIYQKDDPALGKIAKLAGYGAEQLTHPYIGEPLAVAQDRKKPITAILNALELPFYESASTKIKAKEEPKSLIAEVSASGNIPNNQNDIKVLYEDAQRVINRYPDNSAKIRTGLKENQTLQEAQAELVEAKNLLRQLEQEKPEQVYQIGLEVYESGGGKNVQERADWAEKWLKASKDQKQFDEWYQDMLDSKVLTKSVLEELRNRGLNLSKYASGDSVKTLSSGGSVKAKKPTTVKLTKSTGLSGLPKLNIPEPPKINIKVADIKPGTLKVRSGNYQPAKIKGFTNTLAQGTTKLL